MLKKITRPCHCGKAVDSRPVPHATNSLKEPRSDGANASTRALSSSASEDPTGHNKANTNTAAMSLPSVDPGKKKVGLIVPEGEGKWKPFEAQEGGPVVGRRQERAKTLDPLAAEALKKYVERNKLAQEKEAVSMRAESVKFIQATESFQCDDDSDSASRALVSSTPSQSPDDERGPTSAGKPPAARKNRGGVQTSNSFVQPDQPKSRQSVMSVPAKEFGGKIEAFDVFSPDVRSFRWREFQGLLSSGHVDAIDDFREAGKRAGREKAMTLAVVKTDPGGGFSTLH